MPYRQLVVLFYILLVSCSKNSLTYEEIPEEIFYSCADYSRVTNPNFDTDDLYAFWNIFVEDAKCSMLGNPDYDKLNTDVDIYYEFESDALFTSGQVLDYGAYAATSCDDSRVRVGIGHPKDKKKVNNHVLEDFNENEEDKIKDITDNIVKLVPTLINKQMDTFSSKVNQNLNGF